MKVLKFGGTSVGTPERMNHVASLITKAGDSKIVVLSAVSGTTNKLVEFTELLAERDKKRSTKLIDTLLGGYNDFVATLNQSPMFYNSGMAIVNEHFNFLKAQIAKEYTPLVEREVLAQGELLSTKLFHNMLQEKRIDSAILMALDFMRIDENGEPEIEKISTKLKALILKNPSKLYITQGFICLNEKSEIDNLKRGGSDYSATIIGAAVQVAEVQIWTDIDGMHNNDPRLVEKTFPIAKLSFDEAAELSYFGAKILHPASIWPAQKFNVPVRLKNTMQPDAKGTYISNETTNDDIKAIAAKDGITAIKIKSSRMILAYGFLRKVFEIFEKYKTSIDMITTSEVAVSLTIDDDKNLPNIIEELQQYGAVEIDNGQTIVCVVGSQVSENKGVVRKLFDTLDQIPIRMISFGGSKNNISLLIDTKYKKPVLDRLNIGLFSADLI